jgi:phospholipid-binding lipoprotein MlaA
MSLARVTVALSAALLLSACATEEPVADGGIADPFEATNREFHEFNKGLDLILIRPTAYVYDAVTPALFRHLIGNGLETLSLPTVFANHLLQGDPMAALRTAGRLGVNLAFGLGVLDPATEFGLPRERTDLGVTLAVWGVPEGPYVVLPVFGPGSARDAGGRVAQIFLDPLDYIFDTGNELGFGRAIGSVIDARAENFDLIDRVLYETPDSYVTLRATVTQMRRREILGGPTAESLPDVFGDD